MLMRVKRNARDVQNKKGLEFVVYSFSKTGKMKDQM
jgi:hypothetical protein